MAARRLFFLLVILSTNSFGSVKDNILKRKIDYRANEQRLESTLLGIANVGDFSFSYDPSIIAGDSIITLNIENSTVKDVLDVIFSKSLVYKVSGNHLILLKSKPKKKKENIRYSVSGFVYDDKTGERLSSTTVYEVYTLTSTITDEQGFYSFRLQKKYEEFGLAFSKKEFIDTLVMVKPADIKMNMRLRQKWTQEELEAKSPDLETSVKPFDKISVVQTFVPKDQFSRSDNIDVIESRPAQISLIPKIGTNLKMSGSIENSFSLNIFVGYSAGVRVMELGGLANINKQNVSGFQAAGFSNVVGDEPKVCSWLV